MSDLRIFDDAATLMRAAANHVIQCAQTAIQEHGRFTLALSGGSTPRALYQRLAETGGLEWDKLQVFWGDERCVPPDNPDSNYRMARESLLDAVPLPTENIHRIHAELKPVQAAEAYDAMLRAVFGQDVRFDLILLGMGDDGHCASLFPESAALDEQEALVVANYVAKLDSWRITLTAPTINRAAHVAFLVAGEAKAEALQAVLEGPYQPRIYPAQLIAPESGDLVFLVDGAAASLLHE